MDEIWSKFDYKKFEELAFDYAKFISDPSIIWIPTQATRDGGKDGEAKIFEKKIFANRKLSKYAWYEAKYTKKYFRAIYKGKIAATILSGMRHRDKIDVILVITNAFFSTSTKLEINYLMKETVQFVEGSELVDWLLSDKQIISKYDIIDKLDRPNYKLLNISKSIITNQSSVFNSIVSPSEKLVINNKYELHFCIAIPLYKKIEESVQVTFDPITDFLDFELEDSYLMKNGSNFFTIPIRPKKEGSISEPLILIKDSSGKIIGEIEKQVSISIDNEIQLLIASQISILNQLMQQYLFSKTTKGSYLHLISGNAGLGKSYVLNEFATDTQNSDIIYLKFKSNEIENSYLLITALAFIIFGNIVLDKNLSEEDIKDIENVGIFNRQYTSYLHKLINKDESIENINEILEDTNFTLPFTDNTRNKVVLLDDIHQLQYKQELFLDKILNNLSLTKQNVFIVCTKRKKTFSSKSLETTFQRLSYRETYEIKIVLDDIEDALREYQFNDKLPKKILSLLSNNIFALKRFLTLLEANKNKNLLEFIQRKNVAKALEGNIYADQIHSLKLDVYELKIINIIYFFNEGVDIDYLNSAFGSIKTRRLLSANLIKYQHREKSFVPYHDLYVENFIIDSNYYEDIYNYGKYCEELGSIDEYIRALIIYPDKFIENLDFFINHVETLYKEHKFYTLFHVLNTYFGNDLNKSLINDNYIKGLFLYYFAYATFNVGDNNGKAIFYKAKEVLEKEKSSSIKTLALAEIINCNYWESGFKELERNVSELKTLVKKIKAKDENIQRGLFYSERRLMNSYFLQDNTTEGNKVYERLAMDLEKSQNNHFAILLGISHAANSFMTSPKVTFEKFSKLKNIINDEAPKDQLRFYTQFFKYKFFLTGSGLLDLEKIIQDYTDLKLMNNRDKAKFTLCLCYAYKKDFLKLEESLKSLIRLRKYPKIIEGLFHHLSALLYLHKRSHSDAINSLNEQKKCWKGFGKSYIGKIDHNIIYARRFFPELTVDYKLTEGRRDFYWLEVRY